MMTFDDAALAMGEQPWPEEAGIRYSVAHDTRYHYEHPVSVAHHLAHLQPRATRWQQPLHWDLHISPQPDGRSRQHDWFGNWVERFWLTQEHHGLLLRAESLVQLWPRPGEAALARSVPWEQWRDALRSPHAPGPLLTVQGYVSDSPLLRIDAAFIDYAVTSFPPGRPLLQGALDLTRRIFADFSFDATATDVSTPVAQVLAQRRGVCQDFAHVMIGAMRALGLPARYMSGYILNEPVDGGPRLIGADASHAWVSVCCPVLGWVDFDPTNCALVNLEHITVGWGRDFGDVSLLRGVVLGGGAHVPDVAVTVRRLS